MNVLQITDDGKLCVADYRSIHKAILVVLIDGSKTVYDLVKTIRENYIEFKYIKLRLIAIAIAELIKQKMIENKYEEDYV